MFEKTLQDLVKGVRNASNDSAAYIAKATQEIKEELKSRDVTIKAQALQKLTYLNMLGHDMNWAAFHVIEVMSQERFGLKRIGFLAASQSFNAKTDVLVLCTQLLKKEFSAKSPFEIGTAISTLANIATEDLSRDLLSDIVSMLSSSRPYIRKKATLVLYKLYLAYPQGLRLTFDHLKRRLTDDHPAIISCAVNVICELARKKPSNYLSLAPELFNLLTNSTNNWMLIKIAKLMSALVQEEPRLARKLLEPLANIVQNTPAKSLMYECISTITFALQHTKKADGTDAKNAPAVVRLCTDRLREFVRDPDQNLKYLGLVGLVNLMKSNPRVVAEHRELVLQCLTDEDVTIRTRALELLCGMVTRKNLPDIVKALMGHLEAAEGHYRDELIDKIIFMCSRDKYAYLADFAWYIGVLAKLAFIQGTKHSATIAGQLLDVAVRVEDSRPFALQTLLPLLADPVLFQNAKMESGGAFGTGSVSSAASAAAKAGAEMAAAAAVEGSAVATFASGRAGAGQVLYAAAWVVGEYCSIIPPQMHGAVIDALLQPSVALLPPAVQAVYVQCALKILAAAANLSSKEGKAGQESFLKLAASVLERLNPFAQSADVEVQERACLVQQLLATLGIPYTPIAIATPASTAAAKAKAESELMQAMMADDEAKPAEAAASTSKVPSNLPPLEPDMRLISGVLTSLFSEPLKPVNPKAQKKVSVPDGLNLDAWINPAEESADAEDKRTAFVYNSISFEDSYGVADDDFAGSKGKDGRRRGSTDGGVAGRPFEGGVGSGADSDDDAWFDDIQKKNKRRDKALWGGSDEEEGNGRKGKGGKGKGKGKKGDDSDEEDGHKKGGKGGKGKGGRDPFLLGGGKGGREAAGGPGGDIDEDAIPIKTLDVGSLKPNALDIGIFGDFGKKAKADKKDKKSKKKSKKDDDSDDDAPAGGAKSFKILDDEDMPGGDSDDDKDVDKSTGDALANIDLSTPLGDDEVLETRKHRAVHDPAAMRETGKKGKGRARVLGGGDAEPSSAKDEKEDKKSKKDKKEKDEKKDKKDKKEGKKEAKAEKADKSDKKSSKDKEKSKEKDEKKESKKEKGEDKEKSSKDDKKEKKESKSAAAGASTPVVPAGPNPDEVAAAPGYAYPLAADKVIKVSFSTSTSPVPGAVAIAPAAASADAASSSTSLYTTPTSTCTITLKFEPKSSKKAVEWFDFAIAGDVTGATLVTAGLTAGASGAGSYRVAKALGAKEKGKKEQPSKKSTPISFTVLDPTAPVTVPVKVTYKIADGGKTETLTATLVIRASSLLIPTAIEPEAFRGIMTTEGATFIGAAGALPLLGGSDADSLSTAMGIVRSFAVARSPKHAILYAKTAVGTHFTALLKVDDAAKTIAVQVKSPVPGHAAKVLEEITAAFAAAAAELSKKDEE